MKKAEKKNNANCIDQWSFCQMSIVMINHPHVAAWEDKTLVPIYYEAFSNIDIQLAESEATILRSWKVYLIIFE